MLTKGNFTRDEWNNLLHLSNISSTCCTKNFSLISCSTMAKRIQNQKEEERVVSKSRPAVMNMSSYFIATSSSAASSPLASTVPPENISELISRAGKIEFESCKYLKKRSDSELSKKTWRNNSSERDFFRNILG